jgi:hypothetical protein
MIGLYKSGTTAKQVAEKFGVSKQSNGRTMPRGQYWTVATALTRQPDNPSAMVLSGRNSSKTTWVHLISGTLSAQGMTCEINRKPAVRPGLIPSNWMDPVGSRPRSDPDGDHP